MRWERSPSHSYTVGSNGRTNHSSAGMRDDLSDKIHNSFDQGRTPMSIVFMAYGTLREVRTGQRSQSYQQTLPFLSRRAIENKSLMTGAGGAAVERRRVGSELRRRFAFGFLG